MTCLERKCGFALNPLREANHSVLAFSEIAANQAVKREADRSGLTFNPSPGNASLSMSPDARPAFAMQLLILLAYPPTQTDNTPRPCPMLVTRCDYEFWPHESTEMLLAYAWLARASDEHRSAVHQDLA